MDDISKQLDRLNALQKDQAISANEFAAAKKKILKPESSFGWLQQVLTLVGTLTGLILGYYGTQRTAAIEKQKWIEERTAEPSAVVINTLYEVMHDAGTTDGRPKLAGHATEVKRAILIAISRISDTKKKNEVQEIVNNYIKHCDLNLKNDGVSKDERERYWKLYDYLFNAFYGDGKATPPEIPEVESEVKAPGEGVAK